MLPLHELSRCIMIVVGTMDQARFIRSPGSQSHTGATEVVDDVRRDIVRGLLKPGQRLRLDALSQRFGVGKSPLREALSRLVAEGLVVFEDQRGFRVTTISADDLRDVTRTRQSIEAIALRDSIAQGSLAWEGEVLAAHHQLSRLSATHLDNAHALDDAWSAQHRAFHTALVSACGSPWLIHFREVLTDQSERYRRLSVSLASEKRDIAGEHKALMDAVLSRDAARAAALLCEHLQRTADIILATPSLFESKPAAVRDLSAPSQSLERERGVRRRAP